MYIFFTHLQKAFSCMGLQNGEFANNAALLPSTSFCGKSVHSCCNSLPCSDIKILHLQVDFPAHSTTPVHQ